jgi:hypothetical protein
VTSPATNPGAVASGAVPLRDYSCTECGRTFSGDAPFIRWSGHRADPFVDSPCSGVVVLDVIRDDRAGVTLPIAVQPVGGDQLEATPRLRRSVERRLIDLEAAVREELGQAGARVVEMERSKP